MHIYLTHIPLPFIFDEPSTPTELLLGIDGVDEGVLASMIFPPALCDPPVLEFRREPTFPATAVLTL